MSLGCEVCGALIVVCSLPTLACLVCTTHLSICCQRVTFPQTHCAIISSNKVNNNP